MKLQKQGTRKIDLSLINITDNIRKDYDDIESLARSIEKNGQLQPVGVIEQENGTFNMLYGYRRLKAHFFLVDEGKDFNQIEAKITTGDPAVIQLIENIHRKNLTAEEFEDALQSLLDSGLSKKEIAERLDMRLSRVSDALAAKKTRDTMKKNKINTTGMSTSTLSALRSVPKEKQKEVIKKVKEKGGTVKAVKEVTKEKRKPPELTSKEADELINAVNKAYKEAENRNPPYCTKSELCENQTGCKICSYNIKNQKPKEEQEEKPFISITIKEFLHLPEIKAIIDRGKYIVQDKCEYCGKEW